MINYKNVGRNYGRDVGRNPKYNPVNRYVAGTDTVIKAALSIAMFSVFALVAVLTFLN